MTAKRIDTDYSFRGTGSVVDLRAPSLPGDAATKHYVDTREATIFSRIAAVALSGHRAVEIGADNLARYAVARVAGVTTGAAIAEQPVTIQTAGECVEPSWSWSPGPVWLGPLGMLTQTLPTSGRLIEVGIAAGPTSLLINPRLVAQL